jgi:hypothetical protein
MALIKDKDRDAIAKAASAMTRDVSIELFTQRSSALIVPGVVPCETCEVTEQLLTELPPLIPHLSVSVVDLVADKAQADAVGVNRVPTLVFTGAVRARVKFVGAPVGYEFSTMLGAIFEAGGAAGVASEASRSALAGLAQPVELKVFTTPT